MRLTALFSTLVALFVGSAHANWQKINDVDYTFGPFKIYNISLYTENGNYTPNQRPLMLTLKYDKPVDGRDFAISLAKSWASLDLKVPNQDSIINRLRKNFPNIEPNDQLSYIALPERGYFVLNDTVLKEEFPAEVNEAIVAVWLNPRVEIGKKITVKKKDASQASETVNVPISEHADASAKTAETATQSAPLSDATQPEPAPVAATPESVGKDGAGKNAENSPPVATAQSETPANSATVAKAGNTAEPAKADAPVKAETKSETKAQTETTTPAQANAAVSSENAPKEAGKNAENSPPVATVQAETSANAATVAKADNTAEPAKADVPVKAETKPETKSAAQSETTAPVQANAAVPPENAPKEAGKNAENSPPVVTAQAEMPADSATVAKTDNTAEPAKADAPVKAETKPETKAAAQSETPMPAQANAAVSPENVPKEAGKNAENSPPVAVAQAQTPTPAKATEKPAENATKKAEPEKLDWVDEQDPPAPFDAPVRPLPFRI